MTEASKTDQTSPKPSVGFVLLTFMLALANVAAIVTPFEIYPFSNSPMFAHPPVGSGTRYLVEVKVITPSSGDDVFPYKAIGFTEAHFLRTLLVRAYGSVVADAPYGFVHGDDDAARARRLQAFFRACVDALRERDALPAGMTGIRLSLRAKDRGGPVQEIGTYDLASDEFRRLEAPR